MELQKLKAQVGEDWAEALKDFMVLNDEKVCPYDKISDYLRKQKDDNVKFFPDGKNVFRAFRETPLTTVRVIFLGQDPYPRAGFANGLAFGTEHEQMPPSLSMIFDGIEDDRDAGLDFEKPVRDKSLVQWAHQGVLLLNSALTVKENEPGSHQEIWHPFTEHVIGRLQELKHDLIWVAVGAPARKLIEKVNPFRHFVFTAEHPAAASRLKRAWRHNNMFTKVNLCIKMNQLGDIIKW